MSLRAIFLDRDGTVNVEEDYIRSPDLVRLEAHAAEGLRILQAKGFVLVVASNQSGVARGLFKERTVARINERLSELLAAEGVKIDRFYYCPHHPAGTVRKYARECECRKPAPGMLLAAARELDISLPGSYTIGDRRRDLVAGHRAGTKTVLVRTGYGRDAEREVAAMGVADYVAADLEEAAFWILSDAGLLGEEVGDR